MLCLLDIALAAGDLETGDGVFPGMRLGGVLS